MATSTHDNTMDNENDVISIMGSIFSFVVDFMVTPDFCDYVIMRMCCTAKQYQNRHNTYSRATVAKSVLQL